ncbi:hypothetical protein COW36_24135 [bacterium (Candidatus Blackallbacteria) CG17_big_fil_post_rev_8_21_14_2_50_48_46]|uniref:Glycosyltransferase subfamily 4-like N-terminal domain-containing protein n=1 Tax=bacterium (Candidatus Blackallbacteria) CG17_big_fil_post_rev_8_21_14_2_50_48_46 TaxID=2014261 RepID=A0A2M7FWZ1_9BACT|nr:MAG: hypothetical protein COW64_19075 [bacterium (Candidatus Blackallbacteria) CG18_big_fil_WC_8_21_14_2_50_49_26]PIW13760.1 MAG: hypothetical protein COW36_24135 [bacterium (Candidatus Blackallbacteria) CG17_big_fil_post_rev_8_21_14_2_50_48_46]PIW44986.1 MAG: hypothetical protein COW20_21765 [bacterium (Candidatus Blackallbacteria) CG13_big_fil_rev_8_21_14_2_50_49_14]
MSISLIVYCSQSPLLAERHLLHSLKQQKETALDVQLYYEKGLTLPEDLPKNWIHEEVAPQTPLAQIWQKGLEKAQGDWVCFSEPEVFYHPLHFASVQKTLEKHAEAQGLYAHCQFIDRELYPLEQETPSLKSADWKSFFIAQDAYLPLGAFVFKRESLKPESFKPDLKYYLEENLLADWTAQNNLIEMPICSVSAIPQRNRPVPLMEKVEEFIAIFRSWLEKYPLESLVLPSAFPENSQDKIHALRSILQALYNRGLLEEAKGFSEKYREELLSAKVTHSLWIYAEQSPVSELTKQAWAQEVANKHYPICIKLSNKKNPRFSGTQTRFSYQAGIAEISISNLSSEEQNKAHRNFSTEILSLVKTQLERYTPDWVHFSSFQLSSLHMPQFLAELNIPVFYSLSDDSLFELRRNLREPENENHWKQIRKEEAEALNKLLQRLFEETASCIFVEKPQDLAQLEDLGLKTPKIQTIHQAQDLLARCRQNLVSHAEKPEVPSFGLLYQALTQKTLAEQVIQDQERLKECQQILTFGTEERALLRTLNAQNIPATGLEFSAKSVESAQEQGLQIMSGGIEKLGRYLHLFDGLHSAYTLEGMAPWDVVQFLRNCNLAMRKGGRLVLRHLDSQFKGPLEQGFWMDEHHQRPYPTALLEVLLKHFGFQVLETVSEENDWQDHLIDAYLKFPSLPLLSMPVSTQSFAEYWKSQLFSVVIPENAKALVIGPHIQNTWLMYRVQCESMLGISLNLSEITPKHKPGSPYQIHYSRHLLQTLDRLKGQFDVILWQGVPETFQPEELEKILARTRELLSPDGKLHIQSMQLQAENTLFWDCLLNRRPYPQLPSLLESAGFEISTHSQSQQHLSISCGRQSTETQPLAPQARELPVLAAWYEKRAEQVWRPQSVAEVMAQAAESHRFIALETLLQNLSPEALEKFMLQLQRILKPGGELLLRLSKFNAEFWQSNQVCKPYPQAVANQVLQKFGFVRENAWETESEFIWYGRKLISPAPAKQQTKALSVLWQGDLFNYHSLSLVNRHLAATLLEQSDLDLEVNTFSNSSFEPQPGSSFYELKTHVFKPLLKSPQTIIRHHWPPDFEAPKRPGHWVIIQPWEFGSIPERWIFNMNKYTDQVWVPSHFVKDCYIDSGLAPDKVKVVPNGVDTDVYHPKTPALKLATQKKFRFLFVGGGILRKGIDVLLQAFAETFTQQEDVCLVVKEFGAGTVYEALNIPEWLQDYRTKTPNMPEILHLTEELSLEEMPSLYTACDCLVHPYRGEGFGLPIAEAMAAEKPVIVTGFGAALDFCTPENAYLIPAERKQFPEKQIDQTLSTVDYPFWGEPNLEALKALLRHVYENRKEAKKKGKEARKTILANFTWKKAASIAEENLKELAEKPIFRYQRTQILGQTLGEAFQLFAQEQYQAAIEKFEYVMRIDPYQPDVAYNLGIAYMMQQQYESALKYLSQSLREGECTADLCYAMGTTLRHLGDYQTAEEFQNKARQLDPSLFAGA